MGLRTRRSRSATDLRPIGIGGARREQSPVAYLAARGTRKMSAGRSAAALDRGARCMLARALRCRAAPHGTSVIRVPVDRRGHMVRAQRHDRDEHVVVAAIRVRLRAPNPIFLPILILMPARWVVCQNCVDAQSLIAASALLSLWPHARAMLVRSNYPGYPVLPSEILH